MNTKTIGILFIVLLVLVGIFLIRVYVGGPKTSSESLNALNIDFDQSKVAAIQVFKQDYPDSGLYFVKQDTIWQVANEFNTPAKVSDIKQLIADLDSVSGTIRGESADLYPDFDITDELAIQIRLTAEDGSLLAHVYVGKGGDGKSCFMRLPGSPVVYLANNNFISRFGVWQASPEKRMPTNRWMELGISPFKREEIGAMTVKTPKTEYQFELVEVASEDTTAAPDKAWKQLKPTKGYILDETKIRGLAGTLTGLRGTAVANPENRDKFGFPDPANIITMTNGKATVIKFSDKVNEAEDRYVMVEGRETIYIVNKGTYERTFVTPFEKPKENK